MSRCIGKYRGVYFSPSVVEALITSKHLPVAIIEELNRMGVPAISVQIEQSDNGGFLSDSRVRIKVGLLVMEGYPPRIIESNAIIPGSRNFENDPKNWFSEIFKHLKTQYEAHVKQTVS